MVNILLLLLLAGCSTVPKLNQCDIENSHIPCIGECKGADGKMKKAVVSIVNKKLICEEIK